MTTECNQFVFGFHPQKRREIRAQFDGGAITATVVVCCARSRNGSGSSTSLPAASRNRNPDLID